MGVDTIAYKTYGAPAAITISSAGIVNKPLNPMMRAHVGTAQDNITRDVWTTVTFNHEDYDIGSNYNNGTYTFTAPVSGYYLLNMSIQIFTDTNSGGVHYIRFCLDGATNISGTERTAQAVSGKNVVLQLTDVYYIVATHTIVGQIYYSGTGNVEDIPAYDNACFMSITLLA